MREAAKVLSDASSLTTTGAADVFNGTNDCAGYFSQCHGICSATVFEQRRVED
jgi:hypothetical protein